MSEEIVADQDTAYDEVIADLKAMSHRYIKDDTLRTLFIKKLEQLERLIDDGEEE